MEEKKDLTRQQKLFLQIIKEGLKEDSVNGKKEDSVNGKKEDSVNGKKEHSERTENTSELIQELRNCKREDFEYFYQEGKRHALLPILYQGLEESVLSGAKEGEEILGRISKEEVNRTLATYHLYKETASLVREFECQEICVVVLKGSTVGSFYPMPEYRKSGDIDLWLRDICTFDEEFEKAAAILERRGYQRDEKMDSRYHVGFVNSLGLEVELHIKLTGDFSNQNVNDRVEDFTKEVRQKTPGIVRVLDTYEFPSLEGADLIFYNLLHMLHHFTTKGFGWKFICDWAMMFQQEKSSDERIRLFSLLEQARLLDFAEAVSLLAVNYMGLDRTRVEFLISGQISENVILHMAEEIFEAGEFGTRDHTRMLRPESSSIFGLVKLFHLQMKKNYPMASKCFLLWIVLWPATLVKFMYNNKHVRNVSTLDVVKEAKKRGKTTESLNLYKR